ncbi:MAG TPA: outer membrane beta-barrel protein [Saprospiraceae bacterium]|nr:outer membrane beta-barrel protein [Saprospiraceae bacterium]
MFFLLPALSGQAQLTYGFRAGLSYSKLLGDQETDDAGNELDEYRFASGFHIGLSMNYALTDLFGFRGEIIFTQRGTEYLYDGDSYYFLERRTPRERIITGRRIQDYNISMASFEVPLIAYFKIGSFEISGGLNSAFILSSTGGGSLNFEGVAPSGDDIDPFKVTLQYNFNKDEAQEAGPPNLQVRVDGVTLLTPSTIGAYYDFEEKSGNQYEAFDIGLIGGIAFYLNEGLYLSGKVTYGLTDADDNQYDISLYKLGADNSYIYRTDKNQHLTIQASIGFLF